MSIVSDEKRQEAEAITNMKLDAKKLAETLVSCRVVHNKPLHEITNPINDLIKRLASVIQALDVCFKEDDPDLQRLRTAWQEFEFSWERTYPTRNIQWVPGKTWIDCSEKAEEFSTWMNGFSA